MESLADRFPRDRRIAERHPVKTALRVRIWKSSIPEERAQSINLSQRGIFFVTNSVFREGEVVEVLLKMPEVVTGEPPTEWRCTGLVTRIEAVDSPRGRFGVGVRFDCYEVAAHRRSGAPMETPALGLWRQELNAAKREQTPSSAPHPKHASSSAHLEASLASQVEDDLG